MTQENAKVKLEKMLKKCPEILSPMKATRWAPIGKNAIYAAIKNGEIESFVYKGSFNITKDALIDYLVKTANDKGRIYTLRGGR